MEFQLVFRKAGAVAVFDAAQAADLAFHGNAQHMGDFHDFPGDFHIVFKSGGSFAVSGERAVHHDGREALADGGEAGGRAVAVILVHADRDLGVELDSGQHQVTQISVLGIAAGAAGGLDDDRALGLAGSFHDGLDLFHVVDIQGGYAITVFGGMVEQDTHRN